MHARLFYGLALSLALVGFAEPSFASLGGQADTVQSDTIKLQATRHVAVKTLYQVHELELSSGTVVREYLSPNGTVFGVAWRGPFKPNLNQLLGNYFDRFVAAGQLRHADHRMLRLNDSDLVIESAGRMRAFEGRGYLPALIPAGVSVNEIQ